MPAEHGSTAEPDIKGFKLRRRSKARSPSVKSTAISIRIARGFAIIVFGLVLPALVFWHAYLGFNLLSDNFNRQSKPVDIAQIFASMKASHSLVEGEADDYAMLSFMYSEQSSRSLLINKQLLKVVVMQMGFAVASVGLMFIVLGIRDGGADSSIEAQGVKFDFKTGSTGLVTFIIGAAMVAAAGIIYNEYTGVGYPQYIQTANSKTGISPDIQAELSQLGLTKKVAILCRLKPNPDACFAKSFANIIEASK
jgi:hypothetical protein